MANLNTTFFGSQDGVVDGTDSRTQGDENLNALANSLQLQCPNWTTPISKTANEVNDCTEASASETISGTWTFVQNIVASLAGSISAYALRIIRNGNDVFFVEQGGRVVIDIDATAGGRTALEITDQGGSRTADFIRVTDNLNAEKFVVDQNGAVDCGAITPSGDINALSNNVSALNVAASVQVSAPTVRGTSAVTSDAGVTATTFVSGDTWRVGNAVSGTLEGSGKTHSIQVFEEDGTPLGYLRVYSSAN